MKIVALVIAIAAVVALPMVVRSDRPAPVHDGAAQLIIITPHNEQIRSEFGPAFDRWHREVHGEPVNVIFNVPGGTSEIRRMLESQAEAALQEGRPIGGTADLVFGGGSYEHGKLRSFIVRIDGEEIETSLSAPIDFDDDWLANVYGPNDVGGVQLYDPAKHWFGTALSGFGIVYNRDLLDALDLPDPESWHDLCHADLRGLVALVNPGQSGSVTTAFDAILQRRGWETGWRILRRAAANSRYFSASSLKPPIDVSRGDAAMGVCIDFYGRYQAQSIRAAGGGDRVGYVDPPGETNIDPDPISMLANAPNETMAKRFVQFCLTEHGQALWQFRVQQINDGLGPVQFELRRMPVMRTMYARHLDRMVDQVNPFEIARPVEHHDRNVRSFITPLFTAMAMDTHEELREAWEVIVTHPAYPAGQTLVTAADVTDPRLKSMLERFDAMPDVPGPDGPLSLEGTGDLADLRSGWLRGDWADQDLWHPEDRPADALRRLLVEAFRDNYEEIAAR